MISNPIYGKIKNGNQTTNQLMYHPHLPQLTKKNGVSDAQHTSDPIAELRDAQEMGEVAGWNCSHGSQW